MDDGGPPLAPRLDRQDAGPGRRGRRLARDLDPGDRPRCRRPRVARAELARPDAADRRRLAGGAGEGRRRAAGPRTAVPRVAAERVDRLGPPALPTGSAALGSGRPMIRVTLEG